MTEHDLPPAALARAAALDRVPGLALSNDTTLEDVLRAAVWITTGDLDKALAAVGDAGRDLAHTLALVATDPRRGFAEDGASQHHRVVTDRDLDVEAGR